MPSKREPNVTMYHPRRIGFVHEDQYIAWLSLQILFMQDMEFMSFGQILVL